MPLRRRVMVIGLDCASPRLVFDRWHEAMPHTAALMRRGTWGPLRSTDPPITVPAWTSMVSGRDPGELGLYGFRNRRAGQYDLALARSDDVPVKRLWDRVGEAGGRACALFVPLTYPPQPLRGQMIAGPLTPGPDASWAFPPALRDELESRFGSYRPDVERLQSDSPQQLLSDLYAMGDQHFAIARYMWETKRPDFMMMVEMGPDRLHHALWHCFDPTHPRYDPQNEWENEGRAYYRWLDARIGELVDASDDDTTVLVVSDHGARPMRGGVRINEWLAQRGWLSLRSRPHEPLPLHRADVDWSHTRAWGEGGYYARVFLNVRGRDPHGLIEPAQYDNERKRLAEALEALPGPEGRPMGHRVMRPETLYRKTRGVPPDLLVYFGDLDLRSLGTIGGDMSLYADADDRGPDACNHDPDGIFVMAGAGAPARGRIDSLRIYDVAPTVLGLMGIAAPDDILGTDRSQPAIAEGVS